MALVLNRQLAPNTTALVGSCCYRASRRGESALVGERPSATVWRMMRLQTQVRKRGAQQQMRSNEAALLTQQTSDCPSPRLETSDFHACGAHLSSPKVFEDEANGICCYRSPSGEVTCEGFDEGPHFEPAERCERTTACCESAPTQEVSAYKYVKAGLGKAWCEGKDES